MLTCPSCGKQANAPSKTETKIEGKSIVIWKCPKCSSTLGGALMR